MQPVEFDPCADCPIPLLCAQNEECSIAASERLKTGMLNGLLISVPFYVGLLFGFIIGKLV